MKKLFTEIILSILIACFPFTLLTCNTDDEPSPCNKNKCNKNKKELREAYVIGFDQCLAGKKTNEGRGFLLATENKDTVMTYNLPDSVFTFPRELFTNWWLSPFFPDTAQTQYRLSVSYRPAEKSEVISVPCPGYVIGWPTVMRAKVVVLTCIEE